MNLGEARKAIREYHKATGNAAGTVTLMLEYVECGASFANEYGEDSQAFYSSLESVLKELVTLLLEAEPDLCLQFRDRLSQFARIANRLGWCFADVVSEQMGLLDDHFDEFTDPLIDESPRTE